MTPTVVDAVRLIQLLSLLALVAVFLRARDAWSLRARTPVALVVFASSAVLLFHDIL